MSKIIINEESEPQQGTLNQGIAKMVPSTTKTKEFNVQLEISLEDKVFSKIYYHHNQDNLKWMKHRLNIST